MIVVLMTLSSKIGLLNIIDNIEKWDILLCDNSTV